MQQRDRSHYQLLRSRKGFDHVRLHHVIECFLTHEHAPVAVSIAAVDLSRLTFISFPPTPNTALLSSQQTLQLESQPHRQTADAVLRETLLTSHRAGASGIYPHSPFRTRRGRARAPQVIERAGPCGSRDCRRRASSTDLSSSTI